MKQKRMKPFTMFLINKHNGEEYTFNVVNRFPKDVDPNKVQKINSYRSYSPKYYYCSDNFHSYTLKKEYSNDMSFYTSEIHNQKLEDIFENKDNIKIAKTQFINYLFFLFQGVAKNIIIIKSNSPFNEDIFKKIFNTENDYRVIHKHPKLLLYYNLTSEELFIKEHFMKKYMKNLKKNNCFLNSGHGDFDLNEKINSYNKEKGNIELKGLDDNVIVNSLNFLDEKFFIITLKFQYIDYYEKGERRWSDYTSFVFEYSDELLLEFHDVFKNSFDYLTNRNY